MRKYVLLPIWAVICVGFIYLANCSKPLDANDIGLASPDTIFVTDTITFSDTLYADTTFIDTLIIDTLIIDTLYIDTTIVDTVYIDSMFCARLSSHRQEIAWLLFNQEGLYRLEFRAITERIRRSQTLVIDIEGEIYSWRPADNNELFIEQYLDQHAIVRVASVPPHAYGQAIDICLRVRKP